jgi:KDO2-lipid IV(A) lauroyltransferase
MLFYKANSKEKKNALRNLDIVSKKYPHINRTLAKDIFKATGWNAVTMIRLAKDLPNNKISVTMTGREYFDRLYDQNKGVIVVTGHIGPFEIIPAFLNMKGYKISVVGKKMYDKRLDKMLVGSRKNFGTTNVSSTDSPRKLLRLLRDGYALGILADVKTRTVVSEMCEFFGKQTPTVVGPVSLSRMTRLPILPMAIYQIDANTFEIFFDKEFHVPKSDDKQRDVREGLQMMNEKIEQLILRDPTQWIWYHSRFIKDK